MSSHKEIINEFMASTDPSTKEDDVSKLVELLQNNKLSLLDFIQSLQIYITSTNDSIRVSTFTLLSQILSKISDSKLFPKDIEVLMAFLYSKLLDKPVVKYVLLSIFSLFKMKYFNSENSSELMQKLIENYNPKENPQSIRLLALKIVNYQIESIPTQMYSNDLAINCFLHVSQNEKDPNNLFLIFQILQKISKTLDISNFVQQLFDTMFRYYPIAFKSSSEAQESQINSLKNSLNTSLASNDLYASELFPNLIDKFNSATLSQVKLDILTTISVVSKFYSNSVIQENFLLLWNSIKYTLINQEVAQLVSIDKILSYYENSTNESDQIFYSALISIKSLSTKLNYESKMLAYDDLLNNLIISDRNRRFLQSYLILSIISLPNDNDDNDNDVILEKTLSNLFSPKQPIEQIKNKRLLLVSLSYFISNPKFISYLIPFRDDILNLLQSSLSASSLETTLHTLAIQLTCDLILSPTIISKSTGIEIGLLDDERSILIRKLSDLLIENSLKSLRDFNTVIENSLLNALCKLSKNSKFENDIVNEVINNILLNINNSEYSLKQKCILINYLIKISQTVSLIQIISIRLINLLSTPTDLPTDVILQSLTSLFISLPLNYDTSTITKKFLPLLFEFILNNNDDDNDDIKINYISEITRRLIVGLNSENALVLILELFKLFNRLLKDEDIEKVSIDNQSSSFAHTLNIELYRGSIKLKHIPILLYAIQGLDNEVKIKSKVNLIKILKYLISILEKNDDFNEVSKLTRIEILVGICVIFNKYLLWDDFIEIFNDKISLTDLPSNEIEIRIWSLYGLILKCDSNATESFVELIKNLNFENSCKAIDIIFAKINEISDITNDNDDENDDINMDKGLDINVELLCAYKKEISNLIMVRNTSKLTVSNLKLRYMWKQRILEILLSKKNESENKDNNMIIILPLILTYLPEELYIPHFEKLLPDLINTIQTYKDQKVVISILKIICNIVVKDSSRDLLKPYLNSIIEIVLSYIENTNHEKISKNLLKQSLRCLLGFCLFDLPIIIPYKKRVIKASEIGLGNKSRSVRLLSVSVRQSWEDLGVDLTM